MEKVLDMPGGWALVADGDCSPWFVDRHGNRYRPHDLASFASAWLGPLEEAERVRRKRGAPTSVVMAILNARLMLERVLNGPPAGRAGADDRED